MKLARNTGIDRPCPRKRQESAAASVVKNPPKTEIEKNVVSAARSSGACPTCPRKKRPTGTAAAKSGSDSAAIQTPWAKNAAARAPLPAPWNCATKTVAYEAVAVMRTAKVPASVPPVSEAPAAAGE